MNSTYFALMSEFGSGTVPLAQVCEKYFGLNEAQAQRGLEIISYHFQLLEVQRVRNHQC
jgi:hypothetical protein